MSRLTYQKFLLCFLTRVKTYTHTKNKTCTFTGFHLTAVTDADDDVDVNDAVDADADNAGHHSLRRHIANKRLPLTTALFQFSS